MKELNVKAEKDVAGKSFGKVALYIECAPRNRGFGARRKDIKKGSATAEPFNIQQIISYSRTWGKRRFR